MWRRKKCPAREPISKQTIIFSVFVTVLFWLAFFALVFEAGLLAMHHEPITGYVRGWVDYVPWLVIPFILAFGVFVGHFFWGPWKGAATPREPNHLPIFRKGTS